MPAVKNYQDLPWTHPLRRLAEFRQSFEREPGADGLFLKRMGITPQQKARWFLRPEMIRLSELLSVCQNLKLSRREAVWVVGAMLDRSKHEPLPVWDYIHRLCQTDVSEIIAMFASAALVVALLPTIIS